MKKLNISYKKKIVKNIKCYKEKSKIVGSVFVINC